jgi:hypothetical protein
MAELVDKRAFLAGRVCLTQGWYVHHTPGEIPGPGLQWRFFAGQEVGRLARVWLGEGKYLQRTPLDAALEATAAALKDVESKLLFEASFTWGGLVARADALRRTEIGFTLIEVKSGKSKENGEVSEEFLDDIAYTACVAMNAGLSVKRASLVLLNRDYRLDGAAELLKEIDVTEEVLARASAFSLDAQAIAAAVAGDARPEPRLKFACKECDFFESDCVGKGIPDHLFVLPRLLAKRFEELRPYERISRLPPTAALTEIQQRVVDVILSGKPRSHAAGLAILEDVTWPVHYLDFEAVSPHVPWFEASPPYDTLPFQYSLHIRSAPGAPPEHRFYLADAEGDWRRDLAERMLADLGTAGSIMVYSSYEKGRLKALAELFPDLRGALERVIARLWDLEKVFKDGYTHPGFAGRTSIKKVLPVMVPELSYERLPVNNGSDAAGVFGLMRVGEYAADTHAVHRERLLEYCKLDTTAMVRLHEAAMLIRKNAG